MGVPYPRAGINEVRDPFVVVDESFALAFSGSGSTIWVRSMRAGSFATTGGGKGAETSTATAKEGLERIERGRRRTTRRRRLGVVRVRMRLLLLGRCRSRRRRRRVRRRFRCIVVSRDARSRLRRRRRVSTPRLWLLLRVLILLASAHLALVGARQHLFFVAVFGATHRDRRGCCRALTALLLLLLIVRLRSTRFMAASLLRRLLSILVS